MLIKNNSLKWEVDLIVQEEVDLIILKVCHLKCIKIIIICKDNIVLIHIEIINE